MPGTITFEVYAFINDRWLLDSSFKPDQRPRAVHEAQQLAKRPDVEVTKVIRETFDVARNLIKESTIYRSDRSGTADIRVSDTAAKRQSQETRQLQQVEAAYKRGTDLVSSEDKEAPSIEAKIDVPITTYKAGSSSQFGILVFKVVAIGVVSFVFATITTWVIAST